MLLFYGGSLNGQKYHCISFVSWHIKYRSILLMVLISLLSWRTIQICSTNEESTILDYSIVKEQIKKIFAFSHSMKLRRLFSKANFIRKIRQSQ
ncbi:hypothetical protein PNI0076_02095 [Streptococcus pneumoniae PNI0076]|nr:hypothetical protein PCS81218_00440 [Streptococcus pneumoniae PCS81218]ELU81134.1 hypothetical protein PNI0076_02095 [Streptococcus pneumoniae PNI0076]ELU81998.1 hypothetical protein PNI0009_00683 [Streptococcus pneumoniae PNI0009]ELU87971.1 hypothetical protein PNI0199_00228 [Streptococcus pneumoniae PNI0199]ELU91257.1 hypothetical protein PNI0427_00594 [Streptococcus pneumoniae PNI0427]EMY83312.1 hypothetical protein PNI0164_02147 [Streptococcus pneumoniae PNI0164]EMY87000.1 hypothetical